MKIKTHIVQQAICTLLLLAGALGVTAQEGINTPYSQFGLGYSDMPFNMPMANRMGGAVLTSSGFNYVNPFNPASYGGVQKESFVFDMGVGAKISGLHGEAGSNLYTADGYIGYLAFAAPLTGWWKLGGGLMPYTTVSYESVAEQTGDDFGTVKNRYDGVGGVSQAFLGTAFNIPAGEKRQLQVGFNVNYLTGTIQRAVSYEFQGNDSTFYVNKRRQRDTRANNMTFDIGVQMFQEIGEKYTLGGGIVWKPYRDMTVSDMAMIYTFSNSGIMLDTIFPSRGDNAEFKSRLEQAQTFGIGLSLEKKRKWRIAADATFGAWNGMRYTEDSAHAILGANATRYVPYSRYSIGAERMVNMDASTYWGRIGYSIGGHIERGIMGLELNGTQYNINGWGVGGGAMLPMRQGRSLLTISIAYKSIGTSTLLRNDYLTIGIAISGAERWFMKRKYN